MAVRRVYIIWSYPLFYEAVWRLLNDDEIENVGASSDDATAHSEIEELEPDTIIVEQTEGGSATSSEALQLLEASAWGPRVICMSLRDNNLWVYHREERTVKRAEDLLDLIREA